MYIGTKVVGKVKACTLGEAEEELGRTLGSHHDVNAEGYIVQYEDGYQSWSPKDVFDKAYHPLEGSDFGVAIDALRAGLRVTRQGWNGKDRFVYKQIPASIGSEIIPKMTSTPDSVKKEFETRGQSMSFTNQCAIVHPDGSIDSWVPSISDIFALDWIILQ